MGFKFGISMRIADANGYVEKRDAIAHDWSKYMLRVFPDSDWLFIPNLGKESVAYFKKWNLNVLILSGGDDIGTYKIRDNTERCLIKYALEKSIPIIGICRGMQLIHEYLGGKLEHGDEIFGNIHKKTQHVISIDHKEFKVNSYHNIKLVEKTLHKSLKIFARCISDNSIEGFKNKNLLGMMWHPERELKPKKWNETLIRNFLKKYE